MHAFSLLRFVEKSQLDIIQRNPWNIQIRYDYEQEQKFANNLVFSIKGYLPGEVTFRI